MAITEIWKIHSIERVPNGGTPLEVANDTIAALSSVSMPVQANVQREVTAGDVFASSGRIDFTSIDLSFTSFMAKGMLDLIGLAGACIAPSGDSYNVYVARYDCSGPAAGAVHRRYAITKGMLFLQSMECDHQGDLTVGAQLRAVYDGTNNPVTTTDGVALPSAAQIGDQTGRWTLSGGAKSLVNAIAVANKRSVSVDFGVNTSTQGADSESFDSFASIDSVLPVITVQGVDLLWFDAIGLTINGKAVAHANTDIRFRKRDGAGGFLTTDAIQMTAAGPAFYDQLLSASGVEAATMSFRIEPIKDSGGNAPIVFNTGIAL